MSSILIIDDEHGFLDMLSEHLAMEGYRVRAVETGEEGMELMYTAPPDLVLLDVMLPGVDGYEVCTRMQADPVLSRIPVIMLTARTEVGDAVSAYETGVDDFVTKPFDIDELLIRIRAQLHHLHHEQVSDLTGLPGSEAVEEELDRRLRSEERWTVVYADISNLRVYNEAYSFTEGDNLIRLASQALQNAITQCGDTGAFLGHISGANFVVIVSEQLDTCIRERASSHFSEQVQQYYSQLDRSRGYIVALDRDGQVKRWPLAQLSFDSVALAPHEAGV